MIQCNMEKFQTFLSAIGMSDGCKPSPCSFWAFCLLEIAVPVQAHIHLGETACGDGMPLES